MHVKRNVDGDFRIENAKHIVYDKSKSERPLKGLLRGYQRIYCSYKGKNYKAKVLPSGIIKMVPSGQLFDSPSTAAHVIIDRGAVNGWSFWKYKDSNGNLVAIKHLRKQGNGVRSTPYISLRCHAGNKMTPSIKLGAKQSRNKLRGER